jgi:hypothetical protein
VSQPFNLVQVHTYLFCLSPSIASKKSLGAFSTGANRISHSTGVVLLEFQWALCTHIRGPLLFPMVSLWLYPKNPPSLWYFLMCCLPCHFSSLSHTFLVLLAKSLITFLLPLGWWSPSWLVLGLGLSWFHPVLTSLVSPDHLNFRAQIIHGWESIYPWGSRCKQSLLYCRSLFLILSVSLLLCHLNLSFCEWLTLLPYMHALCPPPAPFIPWLAGLFLLLKISGQSWPEIGMCVVGGTNATHVNHFLHDSAEVSESP